MNAPGATNAVQTDAPSAHELAQRLVARAARTSDAPGGAASTVFAACDSVYRALIRSIGATGARMLLTRALAAADKVHPFLREIRIGEIDGSGLTGLKAVVDAHGASASTAGLEALLETLLGLLGRFVGLDMVMQLVAHGATIGTKEDEDAQ